MWFAICILTSANVSLLKHYSLDRSISKHFVLPSLWLQVPVIARAAGDRGLISQLLGPKYGSFLVFGSLGGISIPGLPFVKSIKQTYKLEHVNADTKVFGVVSNPVGHSKGPLLHNPAFRHLGFNGIYAPLLVDNIKEFFRVYSGNDYAGFRYVLCSNKKSNSISFPSLNIFCYLLCYTIKSTMIY